MSHLQKIVLLAVICTISFAVGQQDCYECVSENDGDDCYKNPTAEGIGKCSGDKCYTLFDPLLGQIHRGCIDAANKMIQTECDENDNCLPCEEELCNKLVHQTCFVCGGEDCIEPFITDHLKMCPEENSQCLVRVDAEKKVVRKCVAGNADECNDEENCNQCGENECNGGVFPTERRKCLQCDGSKDDQKEKCNKGDDQFNKYCPLYVKDDKCYSYVVEKNLLRGCMSEEDVETKCQAGKSCIECETDSCNAKEVPATRKCITCEGDKCEADSVKADDAAVCEGSYPSDQDEKCFVESYKDGEKDLKRRGCFYDFSGTARTCEGDGCSTCPVDGCNAIDNFKYSSSFKCYVCDSTTEKACADTEPKLDPKVCDPIPHSFNEGEGCFVYRNDKKAVIRDCFTNKHDVDLDKCSTDKKESGKKCVKCDGDSCNKMAAPDSASTAKLCSGLLALLSFVLVNYH